MINAGYKMLRCYVQDNHFVEVNLTYRVGLVVKLSVTSCHHVVKYKIS